MEYVFIQLLYDLLESPCSRTIHDPRCPWQLSDVQSRLVRWLPERERISVMPEQTWQYTPSQSVTNRTKAFLRLFQQHSEAQGSPETSDCGFLLCSLNKIDAGSLPDIEKCTAAAHCITSGPSCGYLHSLGATAAACCLMTLQPCNGHSQAQTSCDCQPSRSMHTWGCAVRRG